MHTILIDPTAEDAAQVFAGADRLPSLQGKRIALLDNIKHNAEYLLAQVGDQLRGEWSCEVDLVKKKTYTKFCEPHILKSLETYDAVITAIGD